MSQIVADRYAQALFALALSGQAASAQIPGSAAAAGPAGGEALVDRVDHDLALVTRTIAETPDLRRLLLHPLVPKSDKKNIIATLFGPHVTPLVLNFLQLLFDRGRGAVLDLVQKRFHHLAAKLARRLSVRLITAIAISPSELEGFRERLERSLQLHVELETEVDQDIVGGAIMRVEDQVVDGSFRGRLEALKQAMSQG